MPDKKISEFDPAGALDGTEEIGLVQDAASVRATLAAIASWLLTATAITPTNLPYRGARVRLSADFSPPNTSFNTVSFGIEDRDTDNIWSAAQPTRLIVPAGVTKVSIKGYVRSPSGASGRYIFFLKNGAYAFGLPAVGQAGSSFDVSASSDVIDVVPGDYFEMQVFGSTSPVGAGLVTNIGLGTWFAMQIEEYS